MAPGFGQQPRFIVTIQPVGTIFNPPAAIVIPNADGLPPGALTEMYSYDHDLAAFTAIGTATVSTDGSRIASDPGVGVIKAGWHCGGNPNQTGSAGTCPQCQKCEGSSCVPSDGSCDDGKFCTSCAGGTSPGADCCKAGSCKGEKLRDQDVVGGSLQEWDFTKLKQILDGTASAFSLAPGCKAPSPKISGAIKIGLVKSCCEAKQSYVNVGKFTGEISVQSGLGIECLVPGLSFNVLNIFQAGVKVGITLGGSVSGSGYETDDPQCLKCSWSVDGKIVATVTGSLVAVTAIDPDLVRFEGGIKGEGSVGVSIKCDGASGKGCLGPVKVFGAAILGNFLKKSVDFTIPGTQVCYP
ncbi:MAG: hypothetical protein H7039_15355 [Bryobacteraceae bacterium]|nr:hypothetical protein [Bryobacteraceae bacterium]